MCWMLQTWEISGAVQLGLFISPISRTPRNSMQSSITKWNFITSLVLLIQYPSFLCLSASFLTNIQSIASLERCFQHSWGNASTMASWDTLRTHALDWSESNVFLAIIANFVFILQLGWLSHALCVFWIQDRHNT